jgi:hypothetical protein
MQIRGNLPALLHLPPIHPAAHLFRFVTGLTRPGRSALPGHRPGAIRLSATGLLAVLAGLSADQAVALDRTWIGGNVDWVDGGATANWSPADEPDADDTAIFNTSNTVKLGSNNTVNGLTLSGGISLSTNNFDLTVDGLIQLVDNGTDLTIVDSTSAVAADSVTLNTGGDIILNGGRLSIAEETGNGLLDINTGGVLLGAGTVNLDDTLLGAVTSLLVNDGTISASSLGLIVGAPPAGTLEINGAGDPIRARVDLDGTTGNGVLNAFRNQTLDINVLLNDAFSGDLNLYHNSTIDVSTTWSIDAGATIDVDNGFIDNVFPTSDVPASSSFIVGAAFTQTGGTITVIDSDGTLQFDAPFAMNGGTLANNGLVVFNANSTIGAGAAFTMTGTTSSLTVNAGVEVNVDQANFNADGNGLVTNLLTVGSGGILDLDLGAGADETIGASIMLNGGELDVTTADASWEINRSVAVGAATGISQINGNAVTFAGAGVTVGDGSTLDLNATSTWGATSSLAVGAGGIADLSAPTFNSPGTISGAGTLRITANGSFTGATTIGTAIFDWDGSVTGNTQTIAENSNLTITSPSIDTDDGFDDNLELAGNGSTLTMNGPATWLMRRTITSNTPDVGTAIIAGSSRMALTTATGILNANGDTTISAPVSFGASSTTTVAAPATLTVTANAIYDGGTLTGAGTYNPPSGTNNSVVANSTISTTNFNFDGGNWTVDPGATLTVSVGDYDPDSTPNGFDTTITLNSGDVNVTTGDAEFVMDGTLNMNHTGGGNPGWSGEPLDIGNDVGTLDANLNVTGGSADIGASIDFNSDADVEVAAGATLRFLTASTVNFDTVDGLINAEFTGAGEIVFNGVVNVNEAATLNLIGGTVDLDGTDATGEFINIDAPFVINAATLRGFARTNGGGGTNTLDVNNSIGTGTLTVNLDNPADKWTLNAQGVMNLVNDNTEATLLSGSAVNLSGTVNITGDVRTTARLDIGPTGVVNILTAGQPFRLAGGNTTTSPNTIAGGMINGPGLLGADSGAALTGFGVIAPNANIDFDGAADLLADNGTLTVNSSIVDARNIGTADLDGILNVPNPWNSSTVTTVLMQGGTLQGGALTLANLNGMSGHGTVTAPVSNETQITATSAGQTLLLNNGGNIWDGGTGTGKLIANAGTLECQDNSTFVFDGTVSALNGGTVFANGFGLTFAPAATLSLAGGTFKSTNSTDLEGTVTVAAGPASTIDIQINRFLEFDAGSSTTLNGILNLVTNNGVIRAGAIFAGPGTLRIAPGSFVGAVNTSNINVLLENAGDFHVGGLFATGRTDAKGYQQAASGDLQVDLRGTGLADYDQLFVNGTAQIAGDLELILGGGYVPALGHTFNIMAATGGVIGTFNPLVQPVSMPAGLAFEVSYTPTIIQLKVVAAAPFDTWINSFAALVNPADRTKDANPDGDTLNNFGEFALDGDPTNGASDGKIVGKIAPVGGVDALTLTFPVRSGAVVDPGDPPGGELVLEQAADGVVYTVQASDDLATTPLEVTEVVGADAAAIQAGLPGLHAGWVYRTFRSPGSVAGDSSEFMRVVVSE